MNNKSNNMRVVYVILAAFALTTLIGTTPAFAIHDRGVEDFEWHLWSRNVADGHLGYLNCDTTKNGSCAMKIKTTGSIQTISHSNINKEVNTIETQFDALDKNMSIDRVSVSNSFIAERDISEIGRADYTLHCKNPWWGCSIKDMHFTKMIVKINNNISEFKFDRYEDSGATPKVYDIRKTLGHELFHAIGVDHNNGDSIVNYNYRFGSTNGYEANAEDISDLEARYP